MTTPKCCSAKKHEFKKNIVVFDTNVLLADPNSLYSFDDTDIIIPLACIEELDRLKSRQDDIGRNARITSRNLDKMRQDGGSLLDGVEQENKSRVFVLPVTKEAIKKLPDELRSESKVDNFIIALALSVPNSTLISKDINVRIKCDVVGVASKDYDKQRAADSLEHIYTGVVTVNVAQEKINEFYETKQLKLEYGILDEKILYPNCFVVMKHDGKSAIGRYIVKNELEHCIVPLVERKELFGLRPKNKEQQFCFDVLCDENIDLVSMSGIAGSGKSLCAIAAGLHQVVEQKRYKKLIVIRPMQTVGKDIGALPGGLLEKLDPYLAPVKDNLNFLFGSKISSNKKKTEEPYLSLLMTNGVIEIEAVAYIRGRSIPDSYIIIEEAQNATQHEIKTILTRVGENTKIVLTGDIEQIDNPYLDVYSNGLTYAIEKLKDQTLSAHITLLKGVRSPLATIASKLL